MDFASAADGVSICIASICIEAKDIAITTVTIIVLVFDFNVFLKQEKIHKKGIGDLMKLDS